MNKSNMTILRKKTIMVFDVPASSGGALTILYEYYIEAINCDDKNILWYFVVSVPDLKENENVKVLRFPWIKKSWFHRLFFDYLIAPGLVKQYRANEILSLQNVIVPYTKVYQRLYVHQPLPFHTYRFSIFENFLFWVYQNIIGRMIISSIRKADEVIVQTEWMKAACIAKSGIEPLKVIIVPPKIHLNITKYFTMTAENKKTFFYPASAFIYKNHEVIVRAACALIKENCMEFTIYFTIHGTENRHVRKLAKLVREHNLPIKFIGPITSNEVMAFYSRSVLLFPSNIETFGLPMLEAKSHNTPIIAADKPSSREVLDGYENALFFDSSSAKALSELMKNFIQPENTQKARRTVMVFDVPASSGGALTVLHEYYNDAVCSVDTNTNWIFVISVPTLTDTANVKVIRYPWIKKSWLHRLYFDCCVAPKLIKSNTPDSVLSLQNIIVPFTKVMQTVYVHQTLPFESYRFNIFKNPVLWVYQNIIGVLIRYSIQRAEKVIVQTEWMKNACIKRTNISSAKIHVITPKICVKVQKLYENIDVNRRNFFYPASAYIYKNHQILLAVAQILKNDNITDYSITITLSGHENRSVRNIYDISRRDNLPIRFVGVLPIEEVMHFYQQSVLVFPSLIESFGLPLLEAKMHNTPIIASDMPYAREVLSGYENVDFFNASSAQQLAEIMKGYILSE